MKKICFVSLPSHDLLFNKGKTIGGAEVQQFYLAKELKKRGFLVYYITYKDYINKNKINFDIFGINFRKRKNLINYLLNNLAILLQMKKCKADIYIYKSGSYGVVALFSSINKCKNIKILSSDLELNINNENLQQNFFIRFLYWFDIKFSDIVIAQNKFQKETLKKKYKVNSKIINNSIEIQNNKINLGTYILWVGTIREIKQPKLFLRLAKEIPNYRFLMIGGIGENSDLYNEIKDEAEKIDNLEFKGFIPHDKMFEYYMKSILLVNTSKVEGFPNVYLEAWMNYLPVVSLNINPNGIIKKHNLGLICYKFDTMVKDIKKLLNNEQLIDEMGKNSRKYVVANHDIKKIANQYIKLFSDSEIS